MTKDKYKEIILEAYNAAVRVSRPENCLAAYLPDKPKGRTFVIGAGKAAGQMAAVFEKEWQGAYEGMVVTRYGHAVPTQKIKIREAAHPVPDQAGVAAAKEMLDFVKQATAEDLVICLLSGGGSALLTCPEPGLEFDDMQNLTKQLLSCGADIYEINALRKHLNRAFGGKLAAAAMPAQLVTLAISDVTGDDPSTIASGPTVGDPTTLAEARAVIEKYRLSPAPAIKDHLRDPKNETPKPEDPVFDRTDYRLIATPQKALEAAADVLTEHGITPFILSSEMDGDTNELAGFHVALVKQILTRGQPVAKPCALISGGESTVMINGRGEGGPNTQFMLASALRLNGMKNVYALACDTDGIDGSKDSAGACIDPTTLQRAENSGLDAKAMLENNDSYHFFDALGDRVAPGPTHTNVNDFRIFLLP